MKGKAVSKARLVQISTHWGPTEAENTALLPWESGPQHMSLATGVDSL